MIQEENRLKFWNFNSKANTLHRSPKYTSFNSSNRETLDANICVTFNYINKHQHSLEGLYSPNFHKVRCCGSPIRTWRSKNKLIKMNFPFFLLKLIFLLWFFLLKKVEFRKFINSIFYKESYAKKNICVLDDLNSRRQYRSPNPL